MTLYTSNSVIDRHKMTASSSLNQYKLLYCRTCHSKCVDLKVLLHYSSITEQDRNEEWRDIIEFYATD